MSLDGPGLFTIELNERVYTIKARSHEEASFWVDALLWRQAGGIVTQKSPVSKVPRSPAASSAPVQKEITIPTVTVAKSGNVENPIIGEEINEVIPCGRCCIIQ
jgi:hypothetical protein